MRKILLATVAVFALALAMTTPAQACHPAVAVAVGGGASAIAVIAAPAALLLLAATNPDPFTPIFGKCNVEYSYPNGQGNIPKDKKYAAYCSKNCRQLKVKPKPIKT